MFRHELSDFLKRVLDAVADLPRGIGVGPGDIPDAEELDFLAFDLDADHEDIITALAGLRAAHCLVENTLEFEGALPMVWWTVHPQMVPSGSGSTSD